METLGLLRALYNLLRFNPHTFIPLITDWSPLYSLLAGNSSAGNSDQSSSLLFIRAYAAHILAWVTHMSDAQRQQFISSHVDTDACIEIIKSKLISATADSVTTTASNAASNVAGFSQEYLPILRYHKKLRLKDPKLTAFFL